MKDFILKELEEGYIKSKNHKFIIEDWKTKEWEEIRVSEKFGKMKDTGINADIIREIGDKITTLPEDWEFHP